MATKTGQRGRYICKVGFYDVYAKDSFKPKKDSKFKFKKADVASTVYNIYHAKKLIEKDFKTKDIAVDKAVELLGNKKEVYGL
jgi:hypothetical protein